MRVDRDGALENSTDVTKIRVDELRPTMETTGGDISCINRRNEIHNIRIHTMIIEGILESNKHKKKWYCVAETSE